MSRLRAFVDRAGAVGAEPSDSEAVRTLKRIWTLTILAASPMSGAVALLYLASGRGLAAALWGFAAAWWAGSFLLFVLLRGPIETFGFVSQAFLALKAFAFTCVLGGFFRSDGVIFLAVTAVIYAMFFPSRRRARAILAGVLALMAAALALELTLFRADLARPLVPTLIFWAMYVYASMAAVISLRHFIGQRDRAFRLLAAEKERSEGLLRRIESDLALAAAIQRDLLPRADPRVEGLDVAGLSVSCYEIGGDYYDFVPVDPFRLGVAVGDVSGKGIGAALLMASLRAAFRAEVRPGHRIEETAAKVNDFIHRSSPVSSFVTFAYCEIDRRGGDLAYVNAGHVPPLLLRGDGSLETLETTGFCLGMFPGSTYESRSVPFGPGDVLVLYSDGIPDGRNAADAEYSADRLASVLRSVAGRAAAEIVAAVAADVRSFTAGARQFDDQTLVVVRRA